MKHEFKLTVNDDNSVDLRDLETNRIVTGWDNGCTVSQEIVDMIEENLEG